MVLVLKLGSAGSFRVDLSLSFGLRLCKLRFFLDLLGCSLRGFDGLVTGYGL